MNEDNQTRILQLSSQYPKGLIGILGDGILLSWQISSERVDSRQLGYRVQVASDEKFTTILADVTNEDSDQQIAVPSPARSMRSREVQFFRVLIFTDKGMTTWSPVLRCEAGLLEESDWLAIAIGDESSMGSPSPLLRREIWLDHEPVSARLYVSSMGINDFYINGSRVGGYLNPGWTAYKDRLLVDTHNVTDLLKAGRNALGAELSDGWWRGKFGFNGEKNHYGKEIGLIAQLEVAYKNGQKQIFVTDEKWVWSTGEVRFSSIYDGTTIDLNQSQKGWNLVGFDSTQWRPVTLKTLDRRTLSPRITTGVIEVASLPMTVRQEGHRVLLAGTQNISGWVRLKINGKRGQTVVVRHAEVLEPSGQLHTQALRSAKATDTYVLDADGEFTLEPKFTFHGFQFAEVLTDAEVIEANAVAISSANRRRSHFESSNEHLNRLHENVVWSQLDNFVSIPTDCPQRDERMGWTGDAQAFSNTANTLFDTEAFWRSWLVDLEIEQLDDGNVPAIVPNIFKSDSAPKGWIFEGRAGWADAATIIPISVYEYFGNSGILKQQLNSMREWVNALDKRRDGSMFLPSEFQFGDWCDPDAPADKPWLSKVSPEFVANSYFAHSAELLARAEALVGNPALHKKYAALAAELKDNIWLEFGAEAVDTPAGCSIALEFEIVPTLDRPGVASQLARMVIRDRGKISTGFLTTPLVLHALSNNGHLEAAYAMLFRREFRSWFYAIDMGATTIWERWDAIKPDGSIHTGMAEGSEPSGDGDSMISFNHYAYGAVIDWVYRNVAGISPIAEFAGFKKFRFAPRIGASMEFSKASLESRFGLISVDWRICRDRTLLIELVIPFGSSAICDLPTTSTSKLELNGSEVKSIEELSHGVYRISITNTSVVSDQFD